MIQTGFDLSKGFFLFELKPNAEYHRQLNRFNSWYSELFWSLDIGIWDLFGIWCLEFGV